MTKENNIYINNGFAPADWTLWLPFQNVDGKLCIETEFKIGTQNIEISTAPVSSDTTADAGVVIDSKTGIVQGFYGDFKKSNNIYLGAVDERLIAKIPMGEDIICQNLNDDYKAKWRFVCESKYF